MGHKPIKGRSYPFPPRNSAMWKGFHVSYDQAVEMFYDQTALQQYLGNDPLIYTNKYKRVTYPTIQDAQEFYTRDQLDFYIKKEQEYLKQEALGISSFKKINSAIRSRINPTEDGIQNVGERPLSEMGRLTARSALQSPITDLNVKNRDELLSNTSNPNNEQVLRTNSTIPQESCDNHFSLGWMQSPIYQTQSDLWASIFTTETTEEQRNLIRKYNSHLNEPVVQGEIVVLLTSQPATTEEQSQLDELLENAQIASRELGKLLRDEVSTLHRHFDLLSHQIEQRILSDGLPSDYYAQVATGTGATATVVEQNLKNIQTVLEEINHLYVSQVAMASRTGGMNYGAFVSERAELFKKLDGSFAMLSKRSVQLPIYTQIKRNLNLSTKSVIHHADDILKSGYVKDLGKRIGNISIGISSARGLGYVGLIVGAASGVNNIYEACRVDSTGNCERTTAREVVGFFGGWHGGALGGSLGVAAATGALALVIGVSASAPLFAVAAIAGALGGSFIGGVIGSTVGKAFGDGLYYLYEAGGELIEYAEEVF